MYTEGCYFNQNEEDLASHFWIQLYNISLVKCISYHSHVSIYNNNPFVWDVSLKGTCTELSGLCILKGLN